MVKLHRDSAHRMQHLDSSSSSLEDVLPSRSRANSGASDLERPSFRKSHHHTRSQSSATSSLQLSEQPQESTNAIKAFADRLRRAASPSPGPPQISSPPHRVSSSVSLASKRSASVRPSYSPSRDPSSSSLVHNLVPRRSFSKDEPVEAETQQKGYRTFEPGEYYYNFELPIPQSLPESLECNFGSVKYYLDAAVDKPGTFRTKVSGSKLVPIIRAPSDNNLEISEPIAIAKSWEDQLYYEIVISGKAFPIGTRIPIAFKLTPLAKVQLHRIRVYMTENCEYYCKNKRVHRIEPTKRFLLEEIASKEGLSGNLLLELAPSGPTPNAFEGISVENEITPLIPTEFPLKKETLHPNSTYENIKVHHWIKIVLRISRKDPNPAPGADPAKRKHYEISIDSPIHLLDPHCTNSNVYLPPYIDPVSRRPSAAAHHRPFPAPADGPPSLTPMADRPIHFLRKPSVAPPPFDADEPPPPIPDDVPEEEEEDPPTDGAPLISSASSVSSGSSSSANSVPDAPPPTYELATKDSPQPYIDRFNMYQELRGRTQSSATASSSTTYVPQLRRSVASTIVETSAPPVPSPLTPTAPTTTVAGVSGSAPYTPTTPTVPGTPASSAVSSAIRAGTSYMTPGSVLAQDAGQKLPPALNRSVTALAPTSATTSSSTAPPLTGVLTAPEMTRTESATADGARTRLMSTVSSVDIVDQDNEDDNGNSMDPDDPLSPALAAISTTAHVLAPHGPSSVPATTTLVASPPAIQPLNIPSPRQASAAPPLSLQAYSPGHTAALTPRAGSVSSMSSTSSGAVTPNGGSSPRTGSPRIRAGSPSGTRSKTYIADLEALLQSKASLSDMRAPLLGSFSGPSGGGSGLLSTSPPKNGASANSSASALGGVAALGVAYPASKQGNNNSSSSSVQQQQQPQQEHSATAPIDVTLPTTFGIRRAKLPTDSLQDLEDEDDMVSAIPGQPRLDAASASAMMSSAAIAGQGVMGRADSVSGDIGLHSPSDFDEDGESLRSTPSLWLV